MLCLRASALEYRDSGRMGRECLEFDVEGDVEGFLISLAEAGVAVGVGAGSGMRLDVRGLAIGLTDHGWAGSRLAFVSPTVESGRPSALT